MIEIDMQPERGQPADELVRAARTNREAFAALFDRFYPQVLRYNLRRLVIRAVAEDVTSEVFLKVAAKIHAFAGTTEEDFRRWLFRIATNEVNAQLRQSRRRRELLKAAARLGAVRVASWTGPDVNGESLEWEEVYRALAELPERDASIIALRFFGDLTHEQIAAVLGMKTGAVRVALSRALEKLRGRIHKRPAQR
jgi:RNA polymerase sigma-70 factor (ECF subfamily)